MHDKGDAMDKGSNENDSTNETRLAELISSNPGLPVVVIVSNDDLLDDFGTTVQGVLCVEKAKVASLNGSYIDDLGDFVDEYVEISWKEGWNEGDRAKAEEEGERVWDDRSREVIAVWTGGRNPLPSECEVERR